VFGGIGAYVKLLAEGFAQRGHSVIVAGYRIHPQARLAHEWGESVSINESILERSSRLRTRALACSISWFSSCAKYAKAVCLPGTWRVLETWSIFHVLAGAIAIRQYLEETGDNYDVVEIANWPGYGALLPVLRCPYIVRLSTPLADTSGRRRLTTWCETLTCRRAAAIIAHSEAMKQKGIACYSGLTAPVRVIHLGMPDQPCRSTPPDTGPVSILYIGRAEDRKGTDLLVRALGHTLEDCPNLRICFLGADVDSYARVRPDIQPMWLELKARYADRIRIMGRVKEQEKCEAIARAHWVVIPSRYESFGLVAIEAMRSGTPVMAAACGGLAEVVAKAGCGVLFPSDDWVALGRELRNAHERGITHALEMRSSAREAYLAWYTADRMVDESLQCYEETLGQRYASTCRGTVCS
jgi:glycosyltransferase involved in cell wall biosynthesis